MQATSFQSTIPDTIETGKYYNFFFLPGLTKYQALKRPSLPFQQGFLLDVVTIDSVDYNDELQAVTYRVCVNSPNAQVLSIEPVNAINKASGNLTLFDLKTITYSPGYVEKLGSFVPALFIIAGGLLLLYLVHYFFTRRNR